MTNIPRALAVSLLSSAFLLPAATGHAQTSNPPPATATRPSAPEQTSLPNPGAPPPSTTESTGQHDPDPTIREMNRKEKDKVEREGK